MNKINYKCPQFFQGSRNRRLRPRTVCPINKASRGWLPALIRARERKAEEDKDKVVIEEKDLNRYKGELDKILSNILFHC